MPGVHPRTRFVCVGDGGAPVARSALAETGASGEAAIFGAPRTTFGVQVYGYLTDADRAAGKLTLVGAGALLGRGNTVQVSEPRPFSGRFRDSARVRLRRTLLDDALDQLAAVEIASWPALPAC